MNYFIVHCDETGTAIHNDGGEVKNSLLGEFENASDAIAQAEIQFDLIHIHRGVFAATNHTLCVLMDTQEFSGL